MTNHQHRSEAGFTMIEVMIAMLVTAIALIGVTALFISQTSATGYSRHTTEATVLAEDKIERLRTQGSAATLPATGSETTINERGVTTGIYNRTWTVTAGTGTTYYDLVVTVGWTENGISKSVVARGRRTP